MSGVVGYFDMILLQIYHCVWYWKNFENRLTFGEVIGKILMSCFLLTHGVDLPYSVLYWVPQKSACGT